MTSPVTVANQNSLISSDQHYANELFSRRDVIRRYVTRVFLLAVVLMLAVAVATAIALSTATRAVDDVSTSQHLPFYQHQNTGLY